MSDEDRPSVATVRADREHGSAWLSVRALEALREEADRAAAGADPAGDDRPSNDWTGVAAVANDLLAARPSMAVVANRVNRAMTRAAGERTPEAVAEAADDAVDHAASADSLAAVECAQRLPDRVGTLSRSGTVGLALREARPAALLVAESRPGGEGVDVAADLAGDLTAEVTLTTDAAFAAELARREVGALVVGADRVLPDGRVLNKAGTRGAATAAAAEGVDCYVVAASDKVAPDDAVDREERDPAELYDGPADLRVANPTFDVTPGDRVDVVVTERGVLDGEGVREVAAEHRRLRRW